MTTRIVHPNPYGSLTEYRLVEFENRFALLLPPDYREFLLAYNGGRPVPAFFWLKDEEQARSVHQFYGLYDRLVPASLETYMGAGRLSIPSALMPIGDDGAGSLICLGLGWSEFGRIYFLDQERHPRETPHGWDGITLLADSFTEFLSSLREGPRR